MVQKAMLTSCYCYTLADQQHNGPFKFRSKTLHKTEVRLTGRQLATSCGSPFLNIEQIWKVVGKSLLALNGPSYSKKPSMWVLFEAFVRQMHDHVVRVYFTFAQKRI